MVEQDYPKEINTTNGAGAKVVLTVLGPRVSLPLSGVPAYPVRVKYADGPYYCTGFHIA